MRGGSSCQARRASNSTMVRRLGKDARHMAHLAVGADFELTVKMQAEVRLGENVAPFLRVLADEIVHFDLPASCRRPERPAGDGADVLLELLWARLTRRSRASRKPTSKDMASNWSSMME